MWAYLSGAIIQTTPRTKALGLSNACPVGGRRGRCGLLRLHLELCRFPHSCLCPFRWKFLRVGPVLLYHLSLAVHTAGAWCIQKGLPLSEGTLRAAGGTRLRGPGRYAGKRPEHQGRMEPSWKGLGLLSKGLVSSRLCWLQEALPSETLTLDSLTDRLALLPAQAHIASSMVSFRDPCAQVPLRALSCSNTSHGSPLLLSQV